mgnify:CR=1 FL=1|tara:strand:- start:4095 stop:4652 length:558 start_codon:yes stop_codon:yes gene_type:complete
MSIEIKENVYSVKVTVLPTYHWEKYGGMVFGTPILLEKDESVLLDWHPCAVSSKIEFSFYDAKQVFVKAENPEEALKELQKLAELHQLPWKEQIRKIRPTGAKYSYMEEGTGNTQPSMGGKFTFDSIRLLPILHEIHRQNGAKGYRPLQPSELEVANSDALIASEKHDEFCRKYGLLDLIGAYGK